jgi:hypothetical protein
MRHLCQHNQHRGLFLQAAVAEYLTTLELRPGVDGEGEQCSATCARCLKGRVMPHIRPEKNNDYLR